MKLTPMDIQQQRFTARLRGYDPQEVHRFLEQTADAFEALERQNQQLREEARRLELEIKGYRQREETFKRALIHSQKIVDQMKENARKQAELIVAEAEVRAEKILSHSHNRLAQLHEDISELKRQRVQIEIEITAIIDSHAKLLEISKESMRALDENDAKLKILKQAT
jgi:cell division initiation protein